MKQEGKVEVGAGDGARCRLQEEVEEEEVMTYRGPVGR